jgi:hypothetical protein
MLTDGRYSGRSWCIGGQEVHGIESACQESRRDRKVNGRWMRWVAHLVRCRIESDVCLGFKCLYFKGLALLMTVEYFFTMLCMSIEESRSPPSGMQVVGMHHSQ